MSVKQKCNIWQGNRPEDRIMYISDSYKSEYNGKVKKQG